MSLTATVDFYGFPLALTPQQTADYQRHRETYARQEVEWRKYAEHGKLPRAGKQKKLCREGIPPRLRRWVWLEISGAKDLKAQQTSDGYYANLVKASSLSKAAGQVELDLPRTFPSHAYLSSEVGQQAMRRILTAYSLHNPAVGYCQGLNYIAAVLLCGSGRDEEAAFWLLAALVERICFPGSFGHNLAGCHVEMKTLQDLLRSRLPRLAAHMEALHCDTSLIATDWFLTLFTMSLPAEPACRLLDCLLSEGAKVLFRVALAVLRVMEPRLLALDNAGELMRCVKDWVARLHDPGPLLGVAFHGIGSLPRSTLEAVRRAKKAEVQAFMEQRRQQRSQATNAQQKSPGA